MTNPQIFPSRFVALSDAHDKGAAIKNLINVFRRLHRIFAHAWFQHRGVFWTVEGQTGLYVFFKTVCDMHDLLPGENYKLPPEAEGLEAPRSNLNVAGDGPKILQNSGDAATQGAGATRPGPGVTGEGEDDHHSAVNSRTSTRRHIRSSPSTGSAVTTVMEADEDDGSAGDVAKRFRKMRIIDPPLAEDDMETTEVPVVVEQDSPVHSTPMGNGDAAAKSDEEEPQSLPADETGCAKSARGQAATSEEVESASHDIPRTVESFLESPDSEMPSQPLAAESGPKDVAETGDDGKTSTTAAATPSEHGSSDDADAVAMLEATSVADFAGDAGEAEPSAPAADDGPIDEAVPSSASDDTKAEAPQEPTKEKPAKADEEAKDTSEPQQPDASKANSD